MSDPWFCSDPGPYAGWWLFLATVVGLVLGSFLNVVIHRLPMMMERRWRAECAGEDPDAKEVLTLARPGSRCPQCGRRIRFWENIPVLSYILLAGRCSGCGASISLRYPVIEMVTGLMTGLLVALFGPTPAGLGAVLLLWTLIPLVMIDLDHQLLPDDIVLPGLWLGLVFALAWSPFTDLDGAVTGAVAGYLSLWVLYQAHKGLTGREGMGHGDFKLFALLGAWLGWAALLPVILVASIGGGLTGIALLVTGRGREHTMPFGPFLVVGGLVALLSGWRMPM